MTVLGDTRELRMREGETFTQTFIVYRGGSVENLTGATVLLYLKDNGAARGTTRVGAGCTITSPTTGVCTFTLSYASGHTAIAGTDTDVKGTYSLLVTKGGLSEYTPDYPFVIVRNPYLVL